LETSLREGALFRARHRRRDGSVIPVEVSSRGVLLGDEEVLVSVVRDVSESDAALARILLLNRIHRAINAVDQALVGVRDRGVATRRTCEELVATGAFTAAWLGVPDGSGFLVPEASAGRIEGFFEEISIPLGAGPGERSPAATAFVEERTVVAQDWETDTRLDPLREAGRRRGYRSSAACLVRCGGSVRGVLSIYASEAGVFVPDAVLLLEELARDLGLALDLAEAEERRARAEASLAQSEERYRKLFKENPAPMWVFDVETLRFLDANEATTQLYGYSREELLARTLRDIRPAEDVPALEADVRVARTGIRTSGPWRHLRKDGSERFVEIVTYDVAFEGRAARLVLASDLTERRAAEEEVRRLTAELEERVERRTEELVAKSKELEAFAYSISHDLRAPLRAIDGFSRMIEEEQAARLDEEGRRLLGVVRSNARRMGQLIDDLLAFSRAGRQDLRRSRVETGELVRSVLSELLPEAEREHSDVRIGDLPPAQADPALLRQVFVNLLSNAVKFTSTRPRRRLEVTGRRDGERVTYEIADNGVGFDMRYASKLFGVFQRLHGREFEGTGVGLALVERIVVRHGGTVAARGEVDQGATFTISLPDEGVCS
jgi:PAS domain S-box-containing protein